MSNLKDQVTVEAVRDNWSKIVEMEGGDFPTSNQEATMELVSKLRPLSEEVQVSSPASDTSNPVSQKLEKLAKL